MASTVCWIETIEDEDAVPDLKAVYDAVRGPEGRVDNLYKACSLRPQSIIPSDDLYRAVLHHDRNSLSKGFLELVGSYVALLCGSDYAFTHHAANFTHLLRDPAQAAETLAALKDGRIEGVGGPREAAALAYAQKLTTAPAAMQESDLAPLREAGLSDGEILEINQVVAGFNYWARTINGLGIQLGDEKIGLY